MNLKDLTREELMLLNTDFGEEIEKQASAIVENESEKLAEVSEIADSCFDYGAELAMSKIAEMETNYAAKKGKEEEDDDEEDEDEEKEEEKTASAMGNFILEGYWNTMMEKGAEYYGDKDIYLEELCKEAGFARQMKNLVKRHNIFSGAAMGARAAGKSKTKMIEYAKKKGLPLDEGKYQDLMKSVSKKSLAKGKKVAKRNQNIGLGIGAGLGITGAYAAGRSGRK